MTDAEEARIKANILNRVALVVSEVRLAANALDENRHPEAADHMKDAEGAAHQAQVQMAYLAAFGPVSA